MPESPAIERIFIDWDAPALPAAAELLADRYTRGGELDLGGATIALPGSRAGRRLTELLLEESERRGLRLIPPRVSTIGALAGFLFEPGLPPADPALCRRLWALALSRLPEVELRLLFPAAAGQPDVLGLAVLAADVDRLHRLVGGAGLRFADVADRCRRLGDALGHDDAARWQALARAQREYERELRSLGRSDRELGRMEAVAGGALLGPGDVWLVGVAEMPAGVRAALLAAAEGAGARLTVLVHAAADRSDAFDELGCVRTEAWRQVEIDIPDERLRLVDRPPDQSLAALSEIAGFEGRYSADEIVIGAPDDEVVPYIEQRLASAGLPVRYAAGTRMASTGPFRLLAAVADYLDGRGFEAFAALVRHPDLSGWLRALGEAGPFPALAGIDAAVVAADSYFARHLPASVAGAIPGHSKAQRHVRSVRDGIEFRLAGALRGTRPSREWAAPIMELLVEAYGHAPLSRARPDDRHTLKACEQLRDAAAALHRLPAAVDIPVDPATAVRLLLLEAESGSIAPEPEHEAIEVLGWLELQLDDAPAAIVTGLNEPHLPESINAHPFLPNALRTALGLTDNDRRYARDAYLLTSMLHSRERIALIAGRRTAAGDPLRSSRLVLATSGERLARRVLRFYGDTATDASATAGAPSQAPPGGAPAAESPRFELPPRRVLTLPEPVGELTVTELRLLLEDPYRWCLSRCHRLDPLDDEARELDPPSFGHLAHELLRRFAWTEEAASADEAAVRRRLDALMEEIAAERFGAPPVSLPAVAVQLQQLRARLHAFAGWQAERVGKGWRIAAVEGEVLAEGNGSGSRGRTGFELDVDGAPMRIVGRIDRIDHHGDSGLWAIFDYKTGDHATDPEGAHRRDRGQRWVDLQLPMYRHLARCVTDAAGRPLISPDVPSERLLLGYVCLPRDLGRVGEYMAQWDRPQLEAADEQAREAVRVARRGSFEFDAEAAARHGRGPMAALLGLTQLVAAGSGSDDDPGAAQP